MRPKFETVINTLERELGGLEIGSCNTLRVADTLSPLMPWKDVPKQSLQKRKKQGL